MEEALFATDYLVGNAYSLADVAATPYINRAAMLGLNFVWSEKRPRVATWFESIQARSSFDKAVMSWVSMQQRELFATATAETGSKLRHLLRQQFY
jgi:ganglioside-induced differentiation-associated protein 1